tara:strand:+ start:268 stop:369 length:102 start_codon:yes stop_codon:yes gene_type:complete
MVVATVLVEAAAATLARVVAAAVRALLADQALR